MPRLVFSTKPGAPTGFPRGRVASLRAVRCVPFPGRSSNLSHLRVAVKPPAGFSPASPPGPSRSRLGGSRPCGALFHPTQPPLPCQAPRTQFSRMRGRPGGHTGQRRPRPYPGAKKDPVHAGGPGPPTSLGSGDRRALFVGRSSNVTHLRWAVNTTAGLAPASRLGGSRPVGASSY